MAETSFTDSEILSKTNVGEGGPRSGPPPPGGRQAPGSSFAVLVVEDMAE
jgi:hypothetical protein